MPYGWSGAFQTSQEYLNFKFSSLAATLFPEKVDNGFDFYYNQQETARLFRLTSPNKLHMPWDWIKKLCHFSGHLGAK